MLEDAEPDIFAFYAFPNSHWRKLRSTDPLERFNKGIGRHTDVVAREASTPPPGRLLPGGLSANIEAGRRAHGHRARPRRRSSQLSGR